MRIIGNIEHPQLKITIFKMENRFTVKFENEYYEQSYRFYQDGKVDTLDDILRIVSPAYISDVQEIFIRMHQNRMTNLQKTIFSADNEDFDVII